MVAAERRQEREAQRRFRDLERQAKEQAKLSAIEQARLEVETFDNKLELLLSIHKDQRDVCDWNAIAASLPRPRPLRNSYHEEKAKQLASVAPARQRESSQVLVEQARLQDEREYQTATREYSEHMARFENRTSMARRIIAGELDAYNEALAELNPFAEMSNLGSAVYVTVHTVKLAECVLKVNGMQAIPKDVKTLTSGGKVSVKPMPKRRFHEVYQQYLCSCVLRVSREIFALFPLNALLVTAAADALDTRTGQTNEQPVLSVFMARSAVDCLNFDQLNPTDAVERFQHRGDFNAMRKSETFQPIRPLTPSDVSQISGENVSFDHLLVNIQKMREELKTQIAELSQFGSARFPQSGTSL
jgi:hypothetical protein